MNILGKASLFLRNCGMSVEDVDIDKVCESIISEMELGLKGEKSSLEMIPTYVDVPRNISTMDPVAVIDAGGTNFRAGLAQFTDSMQFQIQSFSTTSMPIPLPLMSDTCAAVEKPGWNINAYISSSSSF